MKLRLTFILLIGVALASARQKPSQQWLDRKFSMFIHFGLYSVYGGVYEGKAVERGYSEQIQSFAGIFSDWYAQTAKRFNPVSWNPDSIVSLAKAAGMKSIVFTSKHHDGFCMYHSQHTGFNIVDATPYGKDLMKGLSEACGRGGIGFSVYFSLIDWNFPQAYPISSHNADPITSEHHQYNLKQVEEIMTGYGSISEIWFDMGSLTPAQSRELYELVNRLQPQCMVSGRLGNDYVDFAVMADNEYPEYKLGVPWQTAASIFPETWGYRSWQERGRVQPKVEEKIGSLIKVISRGGNYLLNIGPRGDGSVVEFERDVLLGIGNWVKANAEAIYGTQQTPFEHPFHGFDVTTKNNSLYFFAPRGEEKLLLHHLNRQPFEAEIIPLDTSAQKPAFTVFKVNGWQPGQASTPIRGNLLTPENATPVFGHSGLNYYAGYKSLVGYEWTIGLPRRKISPQLFFTENEKGRKLLLEINGQEQTVTLSSQRFEIVKPARNSVKWGNLYEKAGRGVFGFVEEENREAVNFSVENWDWQPVTGFAYGELQAKRAEPRQSLVLLQEIESDRAQDVAVEIASGNAVYMILNGKYLTAHFSPRRIAYQQEIVVLPLKKGKNQLVIKFYNGFEQELRYSLKPLPEWKVYQQGLAPGTLRENAPLRVSLRDAEPISQVAPLRMNNVRIKL